jgi:hypothetical protein
MNEGIAHSSSSVRHIGIGTSEARASSSASS